MAQQDDRKGQAARLRQRAGMSLDEAARERRFRVRPEPGIWEGSEARAYAVSMPIVEADPRAVEHIQQDGGRLFVWATDVGAAFALSASSTSEPPNIAFVPVRADGFDMYVDSRISEPVYWTVNFRRFPRPKVWVVWGRSSVT